MQFLKLGFKLPKQTGLLGTKELSLYFSTETKYSLLTQYREGLGNDLIEAIKEKDSFRANNIHKVKTAIIDKENKVGIGKLTEQDVCDTLYELKLDQEIIMAGFKENDFGKKYHATVFIDFVQQYLPPRLTYKDLSDIVGKHIKDRLKSSATEISLVETDQIATQAASEVRFRESYKNVFQEVKKQILAIRIQQKA